VDEELVGTTMNALGTGIANSISPAWVVAAAGILVGLLGFHAVLGTPISRWIADLPFAIGGFAAGNFAGYVMSWPTPALGDVHPIEGVLGEWLILGAIAIGSAIAPTVPAQLFRRARGR
jgi:hypothetical protein